MANATNKCAHAGCQCSVGSGQTYCSPACQQQAQQSGSRQQSQQGGSSGAMQCNCGHPACRQQAG
jgi:hypothetical protein